MKLEIDVPDGISGNWEVETFVVKEEELSQMISMMKSGRGVPGGIYKRLMHEGNVVMSNTPDELNDFRFFLYKAKK